MKIKIYIKVSQLDEFMRLSQKLNNNRVIAIINRLNLEFIAVTLESLNRGEQSVLEYISEFESEGFAFSSLPA